MIIRLVFFYSLLFALISCNSTEQIQQIPISEDADVLEVNESAPIVLKLAPKPKNGVSEHKCLAEIFLFLIGQPKSAIAAIEYPYNTRLLYFGEDKAQVFVENRLNIILDKSEKIADVYCG